jgi:hypothetical protein
MFLKLVVAIALVVGLPAVGVSADVVATRIDGSTVSGTLQRWTDSEIVVATADGAQSIALPSLLSLRWPPPADQPAVTDAPPIIELIDGSQLPIEDFRATGANAAFSPVGGAADHKELSLAVRQISSVRLKPLSVETRRQWDEIREQNLPSDLIVVLKREGQSLDFAEGVVGDVSADKIDVKLDESPVRVDRTQAAGIIYYRRDRRPPPEPRCIVVGRGGVRLVASQASLAQDVVRIKTFSGLELAWPLADIHLADFSAGKLAYLSDLEAASEKWTPLVGVPPAAASAAAYGRVRRDQSAFGKSLSLWSEDASSGQPGQERSFAKGLAVRSRTEIIYRLPAGYRRFTALAGIDPTARAVGNVAITIRGDDRVLLETEIAGDSPPVPIDLDVAGVRRLTILVDFGRNLDYGDWLNLCDARLVK